MKIFTLGPLLLLAACSGSSSSLPEGACTASDPTCNGGSGATGDAGAADPHDGAPGDSSHGTTDGCSLWVDDAGVTRGCGQGGHGPGDRDDGGGAPPPPPPDAALDASDLPMGAPCWDNAQCASGICFDYAVKGQFCTARCTTNADCPPPSLGCNGMGVCREGN
jgi:hypothetical protein